ncbi:hypothetical protein ACQR35_12065 [Pseudarthrobacter sp. J1738]|uniref:hypothetical protein n=1 Tax=Micrococcales TaxID=85006 RepID=UPI003B804E9E
MDGELALRKALMQADRGDLAAADATLRGLLDTEPVGVLRVRALVVLGDLLSSQDAPAAHEVLTEAVTVAAQIKGADDLLDVELERACELLES